MQARKDYFAERNTSQLRQQATAGGASTIATALFCFGFTSLTSLLITSELSRKDFGLFGMAMLYIGFSMLFADFGLSKSIVQAAKISAVQVSSLFWISICVGGVLSLLGIVATPMMAAIFQEPDLMLVNISLSTLFLVNSIGLQHKALLLRHLEFKKINIVTLAAQTISNIAAIILAFQGAGVWALIAMPLLKGVISSIGFWIGCRWIPSSPKWDRSIQSFLAFGGHVTGFQVINHFARNMDNLLLGLFWGTEALGSYSRAYSLMMLPASQINTPLGNVVLPTLARLKDEPERYKKFYNRAVGLVCIVMSPMMVFGLLIVDPVVRIVLGKEWLEVIPIFYALGPACLMAVSNSATGWAYQSFGHVERQTRWVLIAAPIIVLSMLPGLYWGPVGVSICVSICYVAFKLFGFKFAAKGTPLRTSEFLKIISLPILGSIGAACAAIIVNIVIDARAPSTQFVILSGGYWTAFAVFMAFTKTGKSMTATVMDAVDAIVRRKKNAKH